MDTGSNASDVEFTEHDFEVGDAVEVLRHGRATVTAKDCPRYPGRIQVTYEDGSMYHVLPKQLRSLERCKNPPTSALQDDPDAIGSAVGSTLSACLLLLEKSSTKRGDSADAFDLLGELVIAVQQAEQPGQSPCNGVAGYTELIMEGLAQSLLARQSSLTQEPPVRQRGESTAPRGGGRIEDELDLRKAKSSGGQALLANILRQPLESMQGGSLQRQRLQDGLFGPVPGLKFVHSVEREVEAALRQTSSRASSKETARIADCSSVFQGMDFEALWEESDSVALHDALGLPAIEASFVHTAALDTFIGSAASLRSKLLKQRPWLGIDGTLQGELESSWNDSATAPYYLAAEAALRRGAASKAQEAAVSLDVALLAAVHGGSLRGCLEFVEALMMKLLPESGSDFQLGPLHGLRVLSLARRFWPLDFACPAAVLDDRELLVALLPCTSANAAGVRILQPPDGFSLQLLAADDSDLTPTGKLEWYRSHSNESPIVGAEIKDGKVTITTPTNTTHDLTNQKGWVVVEILVHPENSCAKLLVEGRCVCEGALDPSTTRQVMVCFRAMGPVDDFFAMPLLLPESRNVAEVLVTAAQDIDAGRPLEVAAMALGHLHSLVFRLAGSRQRVAERPLHNELADVCHGSSWHRAMLQPCEGSAPRCRSLRRSSAAPGGAAADRQPVRDCKWPFSTWSESCTRGLSVLAELFVKDLSGEVSDAEQPLRQMCKEALYHTLRLLRIAMQKADAPASHGRIATVCVAVLRAVSSAKCTGKNALVASAACRLLAALPLSHCFQNGSTAVELMLLTCAGVLPAELWHLRNQLLQASASAGSHLPACSEWLMTLKRAGRSVRQPGGLSLCTAVTRGVLQVTRENEAAVEPLLLLIDHAMAGLAEGSIKALEPAFVQDLPVCLLLLPASSAMVARIFTHSSQLASSLMVAEAEPRVLLAFVGALCKLALGLTGAAGVPQSPLPARVMRHLRCQQEVAKEVHGALALLPKQLSSGSSADALLLEWLGDAAPEPVLATSGAAPDDAELVKVVTGTFGARTQAVEVAALRLLRCTHPAMTEVAQGKALLGHVARRYLSELQELPRDRREQFAVNIDGISRWLAANWKQDAVDLVPELARASSDTKGHRFSLLQALGTSWGRQSHADERWRKRGLSKKSSLASDEDNPLSLLELLFDSRGVSSLSAAAVTMQRRWCIWIQVAMHISLLLEACGANSASLLRKGVPPTLQRATTQPTAGSQDIGAVEAKALAILTSASRSAVLLQLCEVAATVFADCGTSGWRQEMPAAVATASQAILARLCSLVLQEPWTSPAAFAQLPLAVASVVLGTPRFSPDTILQVALSKLRSQEGGATELQKQLAATAWAAYLAVVLLEPRPEAVAHVQQSIRSLTEEMPIDASSWKIEDLKPSDLGHGSPPESIAAALAELLVVLRRLIDKAPTDHVQTVLELPAKLQECSALKALALSAIVAALRKGARLPQSWQLPLAPLSRPWASSGPWSWADVETVHIWQHLIMTQSSQQVDPSGSRPAVSALVDSLLSSKPALAQAALAVLGCHLHENCKSQGAVQQSELNGEGCQVPKMQWAHPVQDAVPAQLLALDQGDQCRVLEACLSFLQKQGDMVHPLVSDGSVPSRYIEAGRFCCGRLACYCGKEDSSCSDCRELSPDKVLALEGVHGGYDALTLTCMQAAQGVWADAARVAVWLLRAFNMATESRGDAAGGPEEAEGPSQKVKELVRQTLGRHMEVASKMALAEALPSDAAGPRADLLEKDFANTCGFSVTCRSGTWTSFRSGILAQVEEGLQFKRPVAWASTQWRKPAKLPKDSSSLGLNAHIPAELVATLCELQPQVLRESLTGFDQSGWLLLRQCLPEAPLPGTGSPTMREASLWHPCLHSIPPSVLEAEILADLLGTTLNALRGTAWPAGAGWGPDLRFAAWMLSWLAKRCPEKVSGPFLWLAVARTLSSVDRQAFEGCADGLAIRAVLCDLLVQLPRPGLSGEQAQVGFEWCGGLLADLVEEDTAESARCVDGVAVALLGLLRDGAKLPAPASASPRAEKALEVAFGLGFGMSILPDELLCRQLNLPGSTATFRVKLGGSGPAMVVVPSATEIKATVKLVQNLPANGLGSQASGEEVRLVATTGAHKEQGGVAAVQKELNLSGEPVELICARRGNRICLATVDMPPPPQGVAFLPQAAPGSMQAPSFLAAALPEEPSTRDAFGRPLGKPAFGAPAPLGAASAVPQATSFSFGTPASSPTATVEAASILGETNNRIRISAHAGSPNSFEENRWAYYKENQAYHITSTTVESAEDSGQYPYMKWAKCADDLEPDWRVASVADMRRAPQAARAALQAAKKDEGLDVLQLQHCWMLKMTDADGDLAERATATKAESQADWDVLSGRLVVISRAFQGWCTEVETDGSGTGLQTAWRFVGYSLRAGLSAEPPPGLPSGLELVTVKEKLQITAEKLFAEPLSLGPAANLLSVPASSAGALFGSGSAGSATKDDAKEDVIPSAKNAKRISLTVPDVPSILAGSDSAAPSIGFGSASSSSAGQSSGSWSGAGSLFGLNEQSASGLFGSPSSFGASSAFGPTSGGGAFGNASSGAGATDSATSGSIFGSEYANAGSGGLFVGPPASGGLIFGAGPFGGQPTSEGSSSTLGSGAFNFAASGPAVPSPFSFSSRPSSDGGLFGGASSGAAEIATSASIFGSSGSGGFSFAASSTTAAPAFSFSSSSSSGGAGGLFGSSAGAAASSATPGGLNFGSQPSSGGLRFGAGGGFRFGGQAASESASSREGSPQPFGSGSGNGFGGGFGGGAGFGFGSAGASEPRSPSPAPSIFSDGSNSDSPGPARLMRGRNPEVRSTARAMLRRGGRGELGAAQKNKADKLASRTGGGGGSTASASNANFFIGQTRLDTVYGQSTFTGGDLNFATKSSGGIALASLLSCGVHTGRWCFEVQLGGSGFGQAAPSEVGVHIGWMDTSFLTELRQPEFVPFRTKSQHLWAFTAAPAADNTQASAVRFGCAVDLEKKEMWFAVNGTWGTAPTSTEVSFDGWLFPMIGGTGACKVVSTGVPITINNTSFDFIGQSSKGFGTCHANESPGLPFGFEVEVSGISSSRPAAVGLTVGMPWTPALLKPVAVPAGTAGSLAPSSDNDPSSASFWNRSIKTPASGSEAAAASAPPSPALSGVADPTAAETKQASSTTSSAWVWHSDGRLECGGQPWCCERHPHRYEVDTGKAFSNGDLVAVEFQPSLPAMIFSRNGEPMFAFHLIEGYSTKDEQEVIDRLACLRSISPDVADAPIPGLLSGAQPVVLLPPGASATLVELCLDGRKIGLSSSVVWSTSARDPMLTGVRLPPFCLPAYQPAWGMDSVTCPTSGVKVSRSGETSSLAKEIEITLEIKPGRPELLQEVKQAWGERTPGANLTLEKATSDEGTNKDERSLAQLLAELERSAELCMKTALGVAAPRFGSALLSQEDAAALKKWAGFASSLVLPSARVEWWQNAVQASTVHGVGDQELPVVLLQRSSTAEGEESIVPVWEQLAAQVAEMAASSLQNASRLFSVEFVGEANVADDSIRRCPRCGRLLQKTEGCDSMACCMYGSDRCQGAQCDHGGGCGHRFQWTHALQVGPFEEALSSFSADFMASDVLCDSPNRRARVGANQDTQLLRPRPSVAAPGSDKFQQLLEGAGRVFGIAIRAGLHLRLQLNPLMWRWLALGGPHLLDLEDLAEADQQSALAARRLRALETQQELDELGELEFATENAAGEVIQLGDTAGRVVKSLDDAKDFTALMEKLLLHEGLQHLESIAAGLASIIPLGQARLLLTAAQLEESVCGPMDIDLSALQQHTEFVHDEADAATGPSSTESSETPVLAKLFRVLHGFTLSERRGFVQLVSGCRRLPERDDWKLQVRIDKAEEEGGCSLPVARTCGLLLTLPRCTLSVAEDGEAELAKRLRTSISASEAGALGGLADAVE